MDFEVVSLGRRRLLGKASPKRPEAKTDFANTAHQNLIPFQQEEVAFYSVPWFRQGQS